MNRTLAGSAAAILLSAGIAVVLVTAPDASAEPTDPPPPAPGAAASPEMLAAMQRDFGLTATGARNRIAKDNAAGRTHSKLRKKLGSSYAGAWLTADAKSVVVAVTDSDDADEVIAAGATPKLVSRSAGKLDSVKRGLDKVADEAPPGSVPGWYVDPKSNTVVVQARGDDDAAKDFIKASGVDAAAVRVVATSDQPVLLEDVRGGDAFYTLDGSGRCSVGFAVDGGFVTAGHCAPRPDRPQETTGFNGEKQGVFKGVSFPQNDYAWVGVNSNWKPQPWVNDGFDGNVSVADSIVAPVGAAVCRSGSTSGWHCGTVQALDETVNFKEGVVKGLTRTNACADHGDSGGSWISGQQAQGVTSGGDPGGCAAGKGDSTTWFQPVNEILNAYKLSLTTIPFCRGYKSTATGSLSGPEASSYQPNNSYYQQTATTATHRGCLDGAAGADFDLFLQKWGGSKGWEIVATSEAGGSDELISYEGTAGYYRWHLYSFSGAGNFSFGYSY